MLPRDMLRMVIPMSGEIDFKAAHGGPDHQQPQFLFVSSNEKNRSPRLIPPQPKQPHNIPNHPPLNPLTSLSALLNHSTASLTSPAAAYSRARTS